MIGSLGFLSPWLLVALAALPLIWLLLRLTPPGARRFTDTAWFKFSVSGPEKTPARTPWWLTLIRLALATFVILALAQPVLRPEMRLTTGSEPLLVILDNGWDTAPDFAERVTAANTALAEAARDGRPVSFLATAEPDAESLAAGTAEEAKRRLAAIVPRPYLPDRKSLAARLNEFFGDHSVDVLWIAGKLDSADASAFGAALNRIASDGTVLQSPRPLTVMRTPENRADGVFVPVTRFGASGSVPVAGFDQEGRRILEGSANLDADGKGVAEISLPPEIRNSLVRFRITGESSAGAVQLLDDRWQRKAVGLVAGEESAGASQPLLEPLTYVERALAPTSDLLTSDAPSVSDAVKALIDRGASIIVLTETGTLPPDSTKALLDWVEKGGTLLRFASPHLAATTVDELLPVRLRQGERALGGSLSWEEPQPIGSFPATGPFAHIPVPTDVTVNRQVLADPDTLRDAEVWAELRDGTPLVTASARGDGRIILFHVTADPRWSNLPLSGAFVQMLNAIVDMAGTVRHTTTGTEQANASANAAPWKPIEVLDGYGDLGAPSPGATLTAAIEEARPSAATPPGFYDRAGAHFALNAIDDKTSIAPLVPSAIGWQGAGLDAGAAALDADLALAARRGGASRRARRARRAFALRTDDPPLRGDRRRDRRRPASPSRRQPGAGPRERFPGRYRRRPSRRRTRPSLPMSSPATRRIDETSRAGLKGLSMYLANRTALEPGDPAAIDIATDELAFYALLYWPIDPDQPTPSAETMAKVDTFMQNGGTILFDTRDAGGFNASGADTPEALKLRQILSFVDVPPLEPVPPDHVLTKAFYLLSEFPGRWANSDLWVESLSDQPQDAGRPARGGDGVSPILITGNDLAAAWAIDDQGLYLYPTVPADPRQRELAFRAGVNIVMYALTGNYKADQVHVPALLERLGQ